MKRELVLLQEQKGSQELEFQKDVLYIVKGRVGYPAGDIDPALGNMDVEFRLDLRVSYIRADLQEVLAEVPGCGRTRGKLLLIHTVMCSLTAGILDETRVVQSLHPRAYIVV